MKSIAILLSVELTFDLQCEQYKTEGINFEVDVSFVASAEGYLYTTNLDQRAPASKGMAPDSEDNRMPCAELLVAL